MSVNEELLPLRNKIDGLDSELVRLLNERAEVAKAIGEIKAKASRFTDPNAKRKF